MIFVPTPIEGAVVVRQEPHGDGRGFFSRQFCAKEFLEAGLKQSWVQINNSFSATRGTIRGMHMQNKPNQEAKLVRCIRGEIWDAIVDLRPGSKSFGNWFGVVLSADNRDALYVPEGFAHGFQTLSDDTEVIYLVSAFYSPVDEVCLAWNDTELSIRWPMEPTVVSEKDSSGLSLSDFR